VKATCCGSAGMAQTNDNNRMPGRDFVIRMSLHHFIRLTRRVFLD
jgi:hypothetical protein